MQALLAKGAIAGAASKDGATPLQLAATHGHLALVTALLEAGAAVDPKDVCDQTPLLAAAVVVVTTNTGRGEAAEAAAPRKALILA